MFHLCRGLIPQFMRNANVHLQHKTRFIENHNNRWESWITAPSLYSTHFSNTQRWIFHDMNLELCDWFVYFQPITADFKPTLTPLATRPSRVLKVSLWPFANLVESFLSWKEGKMFRPSWWHSFSKHLVNVVGQDPVADPVQGLDQPEFGLHILCLFLLAVNNVQQSLLGKIWGASYYCSLSNLVWL